MESQPQNPEFRINPENFHPCNNICSFHFNCFCELKWSIIQYKGFTVKISKGF